MTLYAVTLNDAAKTDINVRVNPDSQSVQMYGLIAAILDAAHKTPAYKAARAAENAQIVSIMIDGEKVSQL